MKHKAQAALVRPSVARPPKPSGPVPTRERTASYRKRKLEQANKLPFSALISAQTIAQIAELCEAQEKLQGELIEEAVAVLYARSKARKRQ